MNFSLSSISFGYNFKFMIILTQKFKLPKIHFRIKSWLLTKCARHITIYHCTRSFFPLATWYPFWHTKGLMGTFSKTRWLKITIKIIIRESSFAKNKVKISNVCFDTKLVFRCLILEIIFVEAMVDFFFAWWVCLFWISRKIEI